MPERYDIAAGRHLRVGGDLQTAGELDDAGYHFGLAGECAVKHALRAAGVEQALAACRPNPMRAHFPTMQEAITKAQKLIELHASGRLASPIATTILDPSFVERFAGWRIEIRYADTACTPVDALACTGWHRDAETLVFKLVML